MTVTELVDVPLDSPMSEKELARLADLERQLADAFREQLKAEIEHGRTLAEHKDHPRKLWQRDAMFRTKAGGWKKRRDWHQYVVAHGLADSGKEADRLIQLWRDHQLHTSLAKS